jgi:hypothetical protein
MLVSRLRWQRLKPMQFGRIPSSGGSNDDPPRQLKGGLGKLTDSEVAVP